MAPPGLSPVDTGYHISKMYLAATSIRLAELGNAAVTHYNDSIVKPTWPWR